MEKVNCQISPNPTSDVVFIKLDERLIQKPIHFEILNVMGEVILKEKINNPLTEINTKFWTSGIYYFRLLGENVQLIEIIVKN
jgi:hypothetical protein